MKISVVTISFNQAQFLEACLDSIAIQEGPWEHIIVDAGSTDGSRDIIERRRSQFSHIVLEPDDGPADGLNKGFERASGELLYYLNSDDIVLEGAFSQARAAFLASPSLDVISGHGDVVDETGCKLRCVYSDPISRHRLAYGGGILVQPATFMRREMFESVGGFNSENRSSWDGELVVDMFLNGAKFGICDSQWGGFRLHDDSITASAKLASLMKHWAEQRYLKLMGRDIPAYAGIFRRLYALERVLRHPTAIQARLTGQRVFGSKQK